MPYYRAMGEFPKKRHIKMPRDKATSFLQEGMAYEHVITTEGFDRGYSILYHLRPPTRIKHVESAGEISLEAAEDDTLRHHHIQSQNLARSGDPIQGRVPFLFNEDLTVYRVKPKESQDILYRNGSATEVVYIYKGGGTLNSLFGNLPYREGDYVVIPRGTIYAFSSDDIAEEDHLILETPGLVDIPRRYLNPDGQIKLGAPYYERDFHGPTKLHPIDKEEDTPVLVKDGTKFNRMVLAHHPLDVLGWDGFVYPFTFNVDDFEPLTGTVHLPPPFQQTFSCRGFIICTFAPRHLDHHPQAIKVPYVHSNVEADEVLFYVRGQFGSRKGVGLGSMTLHPYGIPHGSHPGTIMASMDKDRTEEMAVMFDTEKHLQVTKQAQALEDPNYNSSWLE